MLSDSQDIDGVFKVYMNKGIMEFTPFESGLHYLDLQDHDKKVLL